MSCRCKLPAPPGETRTAIGTSPRVLPLALISLAALTAKAVALPPAPSGKSYFFATREACHASRVFSRQECAMAFANALAELRDRAPNFRSGVECRLRFALCELRRDRSGYSPVGLGVEIVVSARGVRVAPAMAVETPSNLFPLIPVTQEYAALATPAYREDARMEPEDSNILRSDRFEPFARRPRITAQFSFYNPGNESVGMRPPPETPEQRRARLRAAPFVN